MDQSKEKLFKEDFGLLIEAGFIAVKQLDEMSATRIFKAAQQISPHSTAPQIGLGYIALNKLEVKEAAEIFEKVVEQEDDNYLARVFLGISYLLLKPKRAKGEAIIEDALKKSDDPTIQHLGKTSLEWADKDLKVGKLRVPYDDGTKIPLKEKKDNAKEKKETSSLMSLSEKGRAQEKVSQEKENQEKENQGAQEKSRKEEDRASTHPS